MSQGLFEGIELIDIELLWDKEFSENLWNPPWTKPVGMTSKYNYASFLNLEKLTNTAATKVQGYEIEEEADLRWILDDVSFLISPSSNRYDFCHLQQS